ncbi:MAG TPA: NAD(P)/FAD-dependent oxidoreductase [Anaerolineae bacterium]|nr:NAD(P)/FAD-dependent oxidoreductase [Caldilineae bacterium]HID34647.1 NAD(P)/FAD-dependent oxidoreductase [Anaerolineae bacterium]HIQ12717.1 NAD(P)/FAD-dependent oxidoreductase [Caldilineales bacterium]
MSRIAIIGAGMAGLSAAYDLTRAGHQVVIYEALPQTGGIASGFKAPHWDWSLEKFYHHWFQSDRHMMGLIEELGWRGDVLFPRPYTVVYIDGRFQPLDSIPEAAKFTLKHFPIWDVARFSLVGLYLRLTPWWQPLERTTADAWMRKWVGARVYNALWRPLLVGKFGEENLNVVNMAWLWARLKTRTTRLGTFVGGFQAFFDRFAAVIEERGGDIRLNTRVQQIRRTQEETRGRWAVVTEAGTETFDAVISTSSPHAMAEMTPDLPESYTAKLRALKSMGAVVMIASLKHKLTDYYWHNLPKEAGFPYLAMVEHTNFIPPEHYGGDHIIYMGDYLPQDHPYLDMRQEELEAIFIPALARFNPDFRPDWVKAVWLFRTRYAQPIPPVNHSQNIPPLRTPLPGLYFASMSQVYPWDRGTNFAVEIGRRVARELMEDLHPS